MNNLLQYEQKTDDRETLILSINNIEKQNTKLAETVTVADSISGGIEKLIDREERAVEHGADNRLKEIMKQAEPSPACGMAHIQNMMDAKLYAAVYKDKNGVRHVDYCQRYQDGSFSPRMRVAQSSLILLAMCQKAGNTVDKGHKQRMSRAVCKADEEYMSKFCGQRMDILNTKEILTCLITILHQLPVYSDDDREYRKLEFYHEIVEIVKGFQLQMFDAHKAYYALTNEEIVEVAQRIKMDRFALLKKLKEYGFLYLAESSEGYQTNVRCKYPDGETYTAWRYCILKFANLAGIDDTESEKRDYDF